MYKQPQIYLLTSSMLKDEHYFKENIVDNLTNNYYWSDDWSVEFYIELAKRGFISTSYDTKGGLVLLPELQYDYAVLDFKDLHISKKVKKLLDKQMYIFVKNKNFFLVLESISNTHKYNWLKGEYLELLNELYKTNDSKRTFEICTFEVYSKETKELVAGEVGYIMEGSYTSLSGFSLRDKKYNNYGTLQLVLLAKYLEENDFDFWNLGHPHMEYKKKLGAKVYSRKDFLRRLSIN